MKTSVSGKIAKNTAFNAIGMGWGAALSFFIVPIVVAYLGRDRFGIFSLLGMIAGYAGLLDFSMDSTYVRHISEAYHAKGTGEIGRIMSTGIAFYTCTATLMVTCTWLFLDRITAFLNIPPEMMSDGRFVVMAGISIVAFNTVVSAFPAAVNGLQRMDLTSRLSIAATLPNLAGVLLVVSKGWGLKGLVINSAVLAVFNAAANMLFVRRLLPGLSLGPQHICRETFRKLFKFGLKLQLSRISGRVTMQMDKLLITYLLSVGMLAYFQLGNTLVMFCVSASGLLISALMPAFTELEARGDRHLVIDAYLKGTKWHSFFSIPTFLFVAFSAQFIMRAWVGPGYESAAVITSILAVGWMLNMTAQVGAAACIAIGRPSLMVASSLVNLAGNVALNIILLKKIGFSGVGWGTALSVTAGTLCFQLMLHKTLGIPFSSLCKLLAPFLLAAGAAGTSVWFAHSAAAACLENASRPALIGAVLCGAILFSIIYLVIIKLLHVFSGEELEFIKSRLHVSVAGIAGRAV